MEARESLHVPSERESVIEAARSSMGKSPRQRMAMFIDLLETLDVIWQNLTPEERQRRIEISRQLDPSEEFCECNRLNATSTLFDIGPNRCLPMRFNVNWTRSSPNTAGGIYHEKKSREKHSWPPKKLEGNTFRFSGRWSVMMLEFVERVTGYKAASPRRTEQ